MVDRPLEDWEYPEPDENEDEDDFETQACPSCGADVYEDAEQCPACGDYVIFLTRHCLAGRGGLSRWGWSAS